MIAAFKEVDPITLEVLRNRLDGIAEEMELTLVRSSFSPVVKESMDASASLFTLEGTSLAQAAAIPLHLATLIPCVDRILKTFPVETMREDDVFVINDPYLGGTHLPDIAVILPVFHEGRPVALACTMTHHQDVGGMTAGSVPTDATEIFQEGIRIPPLKLRDAGEWNQTLLDVLERNVRMPMTFLGDLHAQIASCSIGARRVAALAAEHGAVALDAMFEALIARSEELTRQAIRALPDGRYHYADQLDNDGVETDRPVRVEVTVTVAGDNITFDFTGTSPQTRGPINAVPSGALAAAFFTVRAVTDPLIPTNGGCIRPVRLVLPEGSLVNPREPAAVNTRTVTIKMMAACMLGAFRQCIPERVPASDAAAMFGLVWSGTRADGSRYVLSEMIAGGSGAGHDHDGVDVIETDVTNCMNLPIESLEANAPVRCIRAMIRPDSGGVGRYRGGCGTLREYELLEGTARVTHRGERFFSAAPGLAGGGPGQSGAARILRVGGGEEIIPSKLVFTMQAGDRLIVETPGGGGYGPPEARLIDALVRDHRGGKTTFEGTIAAYSCDRRRLEGELAQT